MKRLFPFFFLLVLLSGCSQEVNQQFFAMDTVMSVTLYGKNTDDTLTAVQQEVNRLEALLSRTRESSDISRLNAAAGMPSDLAIDQETGELFRQALQIGELTGGALDITVAPVMDAWGFGTANSFDEAVYRVPAQAELDALLPLVDEDALHLSSLTLARLDTPGMAVDLGAVAKGYTAARLRALLLDAGITSALLDLGGNITVLGDKPDGTPWRVGVKDPQNSDRYFCVLSLTDKTCSTSGGYERYFEEGGETYHHIIDPATGRPAESGLLSVTAVSTDGTLADGLSTACYVMGPDEAVDLWREHSGQDGLDFDLILVRADGSVLITEGLETGLDFRGEEAGYAYEIVRR